MRTDPIPDAAPDIVWPNPAIWDMARLHSKEHLLEQVAKELQLSTRAKIALSAEIEELRLEHFAAGWPKEVGNKSTLKSDHAKKLLKPIVERWAKAYNIRVDSPLLFSMFYDVLKGKMAMQARKSKPPGSKKEPTTPKRQSLSRIATPALVTTPTSATGSILSSRPSALPVTPSVPSFPPLGPAIGRPRLNSYDEKHAVFAVHCPSSEASPKVFLFGISEIQDPGASSISLIHCSEERLKMLMKERHDIEVSALRLQINSSPQHFFHGFIAGTETPFQMLANIAYNEREMPISFEVVALPKRFRSPSEEPKSVKKRQIGGIDPAIASIEEDAPESSNDVEMADEGVASEEDREARQDDQDSEDDQHGPDDTLQNSEKMDIVIRSRPPTEEPQAKRPSGQQSSSESGLQPPPPPTPPLSSSFGPQPPAPRIQPPSSSSGPRTQLPSSSSGPRTQLPSSSSDRRPYFLSAKRTPSPPKEPTSKAGDEEEEEPTFEDWSANIAGEGAEGGGSAEARGAALQDITDSLRYCEHMDKELWLATCYMLKREDVTDMTTDFDIDGLIRPIKPYQAMGAVWMMQQVAITLGGYVADLAGIGKTTESFLFCYLTAALAWNHAHIENHPNQHLGNDAPAGTICTSIKSLPFPCICQASTPTWLTKWCPDGPQLLIVPPATIENWRLEFQRIFAGDHRSQFKLVLVYGHGTLKPRTQAVEKQLRKLQGPHSGAPVPETAPSYVILTAIRSFISNVHIPLSYPTRNRNGRLVATPGYHYSFSTVIIDEAHENRHEKTNQLFTTILPRHIRHNQGTVLFLLSGTPIERGTQDIIPYITWFEASWSESSTFLYSNDDDAELAKYARSARKNCTAQHFTELQSSLDAIYGNTTSSDKQIAARKEQLKERVAKTLSRIMIRRTDKTRFFQDGQKIIQLPAITRLDDPLEPEGKYLELVQRIERDVASNIRQGYQDSLREWRRKGANPRLKPVMPMAAFQSKLWERRPAFVFPHLWEMKEQDLFPDGWNGDQLKADGILDRSNSLLVDHAAELLASSPRVRKIVTIIQELDTARRAYKKGVAEGTISARDNARRPKFVIASAQPIVAATTYECLRFAFPKKDIRFLHSDLPLPARVAIQQAFQEDLKVDPNTGLTMAERVYKETPQIVVGTIRVMGTGINLQRAHILFLTEPQFTNTSTSQAEGRVYRIGQTEAVTVYKLTSNTIKCDRDLTNRIHIRSSLAELLQHEKQTGEGEEVEVEDEEEEAEVDEV
jgi:SNF2-related domain